MTCSKVFWYISYIFKVIRNCNETHLFIYIFLWHIIETIRRNIKFILTSATLGDEKSDKEIVDFGEALCTAKFETSSIIRSHTVMAKPEHEIARLNYNLYRELAEQIRNNYIRQLFRSRKKITV